MDLSETPFFIKLLIGFVFILLMSWIVWELTRTRLTRSRKIKIGFCSAILLTIFTVCCLAGHTLFFESEGIISGKIGTVKDWIAGTNVFFRKRLSPDKTFFDRSFIFIDVSETLDMRPSGNQGEHTFRTITSREQLDSLFKFLGNHLTGIKLVACDLEFSNITSHDKALLRSMNRVADSGKLVTAFYPGLEKKNPEFYDELNKDNWGEVTKVAREPVYYSHRIDRDDPDLYSFPYRMYGIIRNTTLKKEQEDMRVFNNFITEFNFKTDTALYKAVPAAADTNAIPNYFELGYLNTDDGHAELLNKIEEQSGRSIIYIGNLADKDEDMHITPEGYVHGSTLMLNEFYYLAMGYHKMSWPKYILFLFYILSCFFAVIYLVLDRADREDVRSGRINPAVSPNRRSRLREWWVTIWNFILNETFFLALFFFVLLMDIFFHKLINIIGLIYVIPLFNALLKYFIKMENR